MSQNGKIVTFGKALKSEAAAAEVTVVGEHPLTETEAAIIELATFLLDNKDKIDNFICGIAMNIETVEDNVEDLEFHLITSPIDARDYALALRLFEDGFRRNLEQVVEE